MRALATLIFISFIFIFNACSSNRSRAGNVNEQLITNIKENGSKRFSYTLTMLDPQDKGRMGRDMGGGMGGGKRAGMQGGRQGNKENMMKQMAQKKKQASAKIKKMLNANLVESGYCIEGYVELENIMNRGMVQVIGECHESASEQDRRKFPNS